MTALATVTGMDRITGRILSGIGHVRQSIMDILLTPTGSRVCNRTYGSGLPDLVDAPMNDAGLQSIYAATALAIAEHYPFVTLSRIAVEAADTPGEVSIRLEGFESSELPVANPFALILPLSLSAPVYT